METFSALLAICAGNSPVPGEFPTQRPVTRSFDVFFDLCRNKRLSKQSKGWWFETLPCPLWRHRNAISLGVATMLVRYHAILWNKWNSKSIIFVSTNRTLNINSTLAQVHYSSTEAPCKQMKCIYQIITFNTVMTNMFRLKTNLPILRQTWNSLIACSFQVPPLHTCVNKTHLNAFSLNNDYEYVFIKY